jgi:hypothetical protein
MKFTHKKYHLAALACAALFATTALARAADPTPAPAATPPNYNQSRFATGVNACSTQLNNCQSVCPQAAPSCVQACDAAYTSCAASSTDADKK